MVSALHSGLSSPGLISGWGHCVVFLHKIIFSHSAFSYREVQKSIGKLLAQPDKSGGDLASQSISTKLLAQPDKSGGDLASQSISTRGRSKEIHFRDNINMKRKDKPWLPLILPFLLQATRKDILLSIHIEIYNSYLPYRYL